MSFHNSLVLAFDNDDTKKIVKLLNKEKFDYSSEECGFCLDNIDYNKYKLYNQCLNCGSCYHNKCLKQFQKNICINCKEMIY